jgi:hypothetical protein
MLERKTFLRTETAALPPEEKRTRVARVEGRVLDRHGSGGRGVDRRAAVSVPVAEIEYVDELQGPAGPEVVPLILWPLPLSRMRAPAEPLSSYPGAAGKRGRSPLSVTVWA